MIYVLYCTNVVHIRTCTSQTTDDLFAFNYFRRILPCRLPYAPADAENDYYRDTYKDEEKRQYPYIHLAIVGLNPLPHNHVANRKSY